MPRISGDRRVCKEKDDQNDHKDSLANADWTDRKENRDCKVFLVFSDHKGSNETSDHSDRFDQNDQKAIKEMLASSEPNDLVGRRASEASSDHKGYQVQRERGARDDSLDHSDSRDRKVSLDHSDQQEVAREICSNQRTSQD